MTVWASGDTLYASALNSEFVAKVHVIATIAALRLNTVGYAAVFVQGYSALQDGGQGVFVLNSSDTFSADNGGTIIVDAAGHRYYRSAPPLPVYQFGIAAAGNSQGTATALTADVNEVASTSTGGGVILPANPAREVVVYSTAGSDVLVYPPSGAAFIGGATNAAATIPSGARVTFARKSSTVWLAG
jgi:hypothetical protein